MCDVYWFKLFGRPLTRWELVTRSLSCHDVSDEWSSPSNGNMFYQIEDTLETKCVQPWFANIRAGNNRLWFVSIQDITFKCCLHDLSRHNSFLLWSQPGLVSAEVMKTEICVSKLHFVSFHLKFQVFAFVLLFRFWPRAPQCSSFKVKAILLVCIAVVLTARMLWHHVIKKSSFPYWWLFSF